MASSNEPKLSHLINERVTCEDLAERLGLERPGGTKGNYKSPHHEDKTPSVAVFMGKNGRSQFKDHSADVGGGPIDMMMWFRGDGDFTAAVRELAQMYGIQMPRPAADGAPAQRIERTRAEFIADKCQDAVRVEANRDALLEYLCGTDEGQRHLSEAVVTRAIARGTVGFNTYTNPKKSEGEFGYGGNAAAFIVKDRLSLQVKAVDMRYLNADANGGVKTQLQGEKSGYPWTSDWRRLMEAQTVYVVESSINALSIETAIEACHLPRSAALAALGTSNVDTIDWSFLRGKQVIIVFDNDMPQKDGYCPGRKAAWRLHELLTAMDISCLMVDQSKWLEDEDDVTSSIINDANDYLQMNGGEALGKALKQLETWMIPGMAGDDKERGRSRLFLPSHDFLMYWRYRVLPDFTKYIKETKTTDDGEEKIEYMDLAGFRVAAVSRVRIASPTSTMTGDEDHSPRTVFSLSVQVPRHGAALQRRVVDDDRLHNIDVWNKLGPVFAPRQFSRMLNIWERAADIGARDAINFVGLAWRQGRPVVNEGPDCFFQDPRQQCPYHELIFPSGTPYDAREVVTQFQQTFRDNVALFPLVWGLGAHLKAFLGFWPHFVMQAEKGTGKTTLVKRLERAIAMVMSSRQSLQTEFRQLTSISYTSHPVGWGEMSANKSDIIDKAVHNLQESYQYEHTRRGADLIDFLLCAPVLIAGEDVPVQSLIGKVVRSELTKARRGDVIPENLPVFPVKQWLQFLARQNKAEIQNLHQRQVQALQQRCVASTGDAGAERMVVNYAALATAWHLLCEFIDVPVEQGGFLSSVVTEMNSHITESVSDRQPWAWITDKVLQEIAAGKFNYPFVFDHEDGEPVLCVRTAHVMAHISQTPYLRDFYDHLPVKSDRVYKKQLELAGVLVTDDSGRPKPMERTVRSQRVGHMVALSLPELEKYSLYAVVPEPKANDVGDGYGGY